MKILLSLVFLTVSAPALAGHDSFAAIPAPVLAFHQRVNGTSCQYGEDYNQMAFGADASVNDLGQGWKLYIIPCGAGAYNTNYLVYVSKADLSELRELFFLGWSSDVGVHAERGLENVVFKNGELNSDVIYRSIGDCGETSTSQLVVNDYSVSVKTKLIRAKEKCDLDMSAWPVVFTGN